MWKKLNREAAVCNCWRRSYRASLTNMIYEKGLELRPIVGMPQNTVDYWRKIEHGIDCTVCILPLPDGHRQSVSVARASETETIIQFEINDYRRVNSATLATTVGQDTGQGSFSDKEEPGSSFLGFAQQELSE